MSKVNRDMDFIRIYKDAFNECPADSIDYAIMEKDDNSVAIPVDIGWSDVGSWVALQELGNSDESNNVLIGDIESRSTRDCYVRFDERLVVVLELKIQ